ncbi:MAG: RluA family pseudouridine synthase [Bacteroidales bacterium]|nr:RluA family pseudouridine synthase [Bacteroidales bacterium]MDD4208722.1 RluA family pseudouridine synthase [Bacteroidales bacterium]
MKASFFSKSSSKYFSLKVTEATILLRFLQEKLKEHSRTSIKELLKNEKILINHKHIITHFDYPLKKGDIVSILSSKNKEINFQHSKLNIIFEDEILIVINKKEGLLSVATARKEEQTAYNILNQYIKSKEKNKQIYLLHRLDRDTSGLMMFAKSKAIQTIMQEKWKENIIERTYIALVHNIPEKPNGTISSYLIEDKSTKMHITSDTEKGQIATTRYKTLKHNKSFALLELQLETGRKNQIRVHLQSMGHPIVGDKKYGFLSDPLHRLCLHASTLSFIHPQSKDKMTFECAVPKCFLEFINQA